MFVLLLCPVCFVYRCARYVVFTVVPGMFYSLAFKFLLNTVYHTLENQLTILQQNYPHTEHHLMITLLVTILDIAVFSLGWKKHNI